MEVTGVEPVALLKILMDEHEEGRQAQPQPPEGPRAEPAAEGAEKEPSEHQQPQRGKGVDEEGEEGVIAVKHHKAPRHRAASSNHAGSPSAAASSINDA